MPDTAERLDALNRRLTMLLGERRALQYRRLLAATKANGPTCAEQRNCF
jgi:hypothetical protein